MGRFIRITIEDSACPAECQRCVETCPVEIFRMEKGRPVPQESEEDECTLCELCLQHCPVSAIRIEKLY
jgi:NAD-dependent dihydropyrimidine dehydrogenase PreA subunit